MKSFPKLMVPLLASGLLVGSHGIAHADCKLADPPGIKFSDWPLQSVLNLQLSGYLSWLGAAERFDHCRTQLREALEQDVRLHSAAVNARQPSPVSGGETAIQQRRRALNEMDARGQMLWSKAEELDRIWERIDAKRREEGL